MGKRMEGLTTRLIKVIIILERIPFEWNIAGGGEIVDAFLWREAREAIAEGPP